MSGELPCQEVALPVRTRTGVRSGATGTTLSQTPSLKSPSDYHRSSTAPAIANTTVTGTVITTTTTTSTTTTSRIPAPRQRVGQRSARDRYPYHRGRSTAEADGHQERRSGHAGEGEGNAGEVPSAYTADVEVGIANARFGLVRNREHPSYKQDHQQETEFTSSGSTSKHCKSGSSTYPDQQSVKNKLLQKGERIPSGTIDSPSPELVDHFPPYPDRHHAFPQSVSSLQRNGTPDRKLVSKIGTSVSHPPQFCHECGSRYPLPSAKFCCECGVRRISGHMMVT